MIDALVGHLVGDFILQCDWMAAKKKSSSDVCFVHVLVYTATVMLFSGWPLWVSLVVAIPHFAIDRTSFVAGWMSVFGQDDFRDKLGPWSMIIVDQVLHITCLWLTWKLVG